MLILHFKNINKGNFLACCNHMGLGNGSEASKEGSKYRGLGILQITGKVSYIGFTNFFHQKFGNNLVIFENNPELLQSNMEYSFLAAMWEATIDKKLNTYADADDILSYSRAINLGSPKSKNMPVHFDRRVEKLELAKKHFVYQIKIYNMKKTFVIISIASILILIGYFSFGKKNKSTENNLSTPTTIDSLQGTWLNEEDTLSKVIINGRNWNSIYSSTNIPVNENSRIYFCDTIIHVDDFRQATFDTTILSGKYIVLVGSDYSLDCNSFEGFYNMGANLSFGIEPLNVGTTKWISYKKVN